MLSKKFGLLFLILVLPVAVASLGYHWHWSWFPLLDLDKAPALWAYAVTLTVGKAGILLTLLLLSLLTLFRWHRTPHQLLVFFLCLFIALGGAFVTKTLAKLYFKEPRPYVLWLVEQGRLPNADSFYANRESVREQLLRQGLSQVPERQIPGWLKLHWGEEVNYSFPSGHAIAAMTLASFFCLLLSWRQRTRWLVATLAAWAIAVCYSRLLLGLHWPADILASALLGFGFGTLGAGGFITWLNRADR
ncbi:phosphatase PAP2 family protein [Zobellella maritima]|uniref:phosphatase PAP2 family protein n=1 Tax=Zobellella maritima TaxID=2059725 RepID=UPI000E309692|nr:phosphatase PAP2 family protein [Zobellella maritima]